MNLILKARELRETKINTTNLCLWTVEQGQKWVVKSKKYRKNDKKL